AKRIGGFMLSGLPPELVVLCKIVPALSKPRTERGSATAHEVVGSLLSYWMRAGKFRKAPASSCDGLPPAVPLPVALSNSAQPRGEAHDTRRHHTLGFHGVHGLPGFRLCSTNLEGVDGSRWRQSDLVLNLDLVSRL